LKNLLSEIIRDRNLLVGFNDKILKLPWKHSMAEHAKEIIEKICR